MSDELRTYTLTERQRHLVAQGLAMLAAARLARSRREREKPRATQRWASTAILNTDETHEMIALRRMFLGKDSPDS